MTVVRQVGFTLLELVVVIVLTGIIALVALPRLMGAGGLEQQTGAANLVGVLRLAQLRTMNHPEALPLNAMTDNQTVIKHCGRIVITQQGLTLAQHCAPQSKTLLDTALLQHAERQGVYVGTIFSANANSAISVNAPYSLPLTLEFGQAAQDGLLATSSWLGQPYVNGERLLNALIITIGNKRLLIEPEGYIHGQ